jgi:ABC-type dipeptide/oligopeptide/nickel transport system permease subunit
VQNQEVFRISSQLSISRVFGKWPSGHDFLLRFAYRVLAKTHNANTFASHMFLFGLVAGIATGFVNGRLWRHSIVRFIWIFPVLLLALAIVFSGRGVYPTMPFESDWGQAFRFYFAPVSGIPAGKLTYQNLVNFAFSLPSRRVYLQLHLVLPAIVGASYSVGALLSGLLKIPIPELCFKTSLRL